LLIGVSVIGSGRRGVIVYHDPAIQVRVADEKLLSRGTVDHSKYLAGDASVGCPEAGGAVFVVCTGSVAPAPDISILGPVKVFCPVNVLSWASLAALALRVSTFSSVALGAGSV
jgi:hypothetical protein